MSGCQTTSHVVGVLAEEGVHCDVVLVVEVLLDKGADCRLGPKTLPLLTPLCRSTVEDVCPLTVHLVFLPVR